jgi:F-type H+-transporting ATPase subunit b
MSRHLFLALALAASVTFGLSAISCAEAPPAGATSAPAHGDAPAAAAGENPDILKPEPSLAIWTVVVFVLLLIILGKYAWKPLLAALHQREEHLEPILSETERARAESERLLAEHRRQMAEAEDRARALLDEARGQAKTVAEQLLAQARTEASAEKDRAKQEIESARDQALSEIWSKTADLAVSAAGKILSRELSPDDHRRLVDIATSELPAAPRSVNGHRSHSA